MTSDRGEKGDDEKENEIPTTQKSKNGVVVAVVVTAAASVLDAVMYSRLEVCRLTSDDAAAAPGTTIKTTIAAATIAGSRTCPSSFAITKRQLRSETVVVSAREKPREGH